MKNFAFLGIIVVFCVLQMILLTKTNKGLIKYLPISVIIAGLLFCLITYMGAFGTYSPSVVAENQYFAIFLFVPLGAGFIGCILGVLLYKLLKKDK